MTEHLDEATVSDQKILSRLKAKYGRERLHAIIDDVPSPRRRGRPKDDRDEASEYFYDAVYCLLQWTDRYKADGHPRPAEAAYRILYEVTVEEEVKHTPGHYQRWRQTTARKLRRLGRQCLEAYLERARLTGSPSFRKKVLARKLHAD